VTRLGLAVAAATLWALPVAAGTRALVMPFDNVTGDRRIFWLGEAASVLLTDDLNALGSEAITREERQRALERLQVPPATALTDATVIRIGQLVGAGRVIIGSFQMENETLVVRARSIALDAGRVETDVTERGPLPEFFAVIERVARRIAPASSMSTPELERLHPPLEVFEDFVKGLLAETTANAISYLDSALTRQPAFDRARLALWEVFTEQGDHTRARASVAPVTAASAQARRARFLEALSDLSLKEYDRAFAGFKALADQASAPALMNNLGVAQLNRAVTPQTGQPTYYFNKAVDEDPDDADYLFNLGYAYWQDDDPQAALYWLREAVRHAPSDADAHFVLGAALAAAGSMAEATRERELARRLSSAYELREWPAGADAVPKGLERIKTDVELPHERPIALQLAATEQRDQAELARFYLERGRRQFQQEKDREATAELHHAVYLSPYLAEAHLLLGRIHLRNGRVNEAIVACKIALWSAESAEAHAVLGEAYRQSKDGEAARAEAQRALALDPASAEARQLLSRLDAR